MLRLPRRSRSAHTLRGTLRRRDPFEQRLSLVLPSRALDRDGRWGGVLVVKMRGERGGMGVLGVLVVLGVGLLLRGC